MFYWGPLRVLWGITTFLYQQLLATPCSGLYELLLHILAGIVYSGFASASLVFSTGGQDLTFKRMNAVHCNWIHELNKWIQLILIIIILIWLVVELKASGTLNLTINTARNYIMHHFTSSKYKHSLCQNILLIMPNPPANVNITFSF